jgi:hypothetical protein
MRSPAFRHCAPPRWRAICGKRSKPGPAGFIGGIETEILSLERELRTGVYRPRGYVAFEITDPKRRVVSAAPFRDRVVHHALCAVIEPLFERGFIFDSYANRVGKGTHAAVARYEMFRDRSTHVLHGDIFRYFPATDHAILKRDAPGDRLRADIMARRCDHRRLQPAGAGPYPLSGRRSIDPGTAPARVADRQSDEPALREHLFGDDGGEERGLLREESPRIQKSL